MKFVMLVLAAALIVMVVFAVALAFANWSLRKRMKGLEEPELLLPRRERRAHARKLLAREDEQYMQEKIDRIMGTQPVVLPKEM